MGNAFGDVVYAEIKILRKETSQTFLLAEQNDSNMVHTWIEQLFCSLDGEMPGIDFRGVSFKGSLQHLNAALREEGLSIIVERL